MKELMNCIRESLDSNGLPPVTELGDGTYKGTLAAHCFTYNGKEYETEAGIRTTVPQPWTITIENGKEKH